nr:TraX family protein [Pseudomonas sp.]
MRRDAGLDLVKWLAMFSMLIDHLRYLWPDAYGLFIIGRLAFPLFCLSIAANVTRTRPGELFSEGNARYLGWLLVFSLISELPYRELSPESATLNVMPTLLLGLLVAWGVHHADRNSLLLATGALVLAILFHHQLMYGLVGVILPAAFMLGLRGMRWWWLPAVLAILANSRNRWLEGWGVTPETVAMFVMAGAAAPFGLALLRQSSSLRPWPVGRWGYWFYPGHLAAIYPVSP